MESEILKFICANQGAVDTDFLERNLGSSVLEILSSSDKCLPCCPFGQPKVVARTKVRVCRTRDCPGSCQALHLCKNFLLSGSCQFNLNGRRRCVFSHELDLDHNEAILKEHELEHLSRTELCTLLLQSDNRLLPQLCHDYNTGDDVVFGGCKEGFACKRLHVCEKFLNTSCNCSRNHSFRTPQTSNLLQGVPHDLAFKSIYANIQALKYYDIQSNKAKSGNQQLQVNKGNTNRRRRGGRVKKPSFTTNGLEDNTDAECQQQNTKGLPIDKSEICMAFIKGDCKNLERCVRAHDRMPYRWEVKKSGQWFPLPNNEEIERDFCDPKMTYSSSSTVSFDEMTCGIHEVRRISTCNSLLEPDFSLATEWLWYWEDERGKWNLYASPDGGHNPADVDSSVLERRFLSDADDVVNFNAHSQKYCLRFKDMLQTNITYGTTKAVRRRPRFVSAADVRDGTLRKPGEERGFAAIPNHWDKIQLPQTGYKRVPLVSSSDEYKEVEALFRKTMRGFDISKIERIQNKALWEVFQLQKAQMKNKNGGLPVLELKLFHGTDNQHVDTICHSNLDWRLCGSHGTAYGKGSYFAVDAQYSHHYTSDSDVRSMFVVRLLVGKYTTGSPEYRRPPSKDGGDINFYDSCVDNVRQPSIYVVFDKPQIYPEYLLQYRDNNFTSFSTATASSTFSQPNQTKASEEKSCILS
ncbi:protein mono-ADP-ribosyltransferase PARP12-like [Takifugu rubripes]|uniref:protein mono-ADP-ribosyltransferase PARP12-like n=1 Tax=Takifugu rubripes TaxID=31033 RepID=UPI0011459252|nr:protein mono-ADP-ribosyltransferase PARP12-like [Takifugu rubripes]